MFPAACVPLIALVPSCVPLRTFRVEAEAQETATIPVAPKGAPKPKGEKEAENPSPPPGDVK